MKFGEVWLSEDCISNPARILGTPQYMAPEQLRSPGEVDARADVYALGCVAYKLLTGTEVFESDAVAEVIQEQLGQPPRSPNLVRSACCSPQLEKLILRCLAKEPGQRPAHAGELATLLAQCQVRERSRPLRWRRNGGGTIPARDAPKPWRGRRGET